MSLDWATILAWTNAVLAMMVVVFQVKLAKRYALARWIRFALVGIGLYWFGLYVFVAIMPEGYIDPVRFGQIFVRPAFTVTLAIMAASGLFRLKSK